MKYINLGLAQINPKVGDLEGNLEKILFAISQLEKEAHFILFPELVLTGYPPEDLLLRKDFLSATIECLQKLLKATTKINSLILLGMPYYEKKLYNSALLLYEGKILGIYHKRYLHQSSIFDEKRYFAEGREELFFEIERIKCKVSFCEDIWYPVRLEKIYKNSGAQILINLNALPYTYESYSFKEALLKARAKEDRAYVVYINMVGGQDDLVFDGRSLVISPEGKIVARAKAFEEDLLVISLPLNRKKAKTLLVKPFQISLKRELPFYQGRIEQSLQEESEIYEALKLALKDYVEKNDFKGVIFGLSGGIDSALIALLATDALGRERVKGLFMPSEFTSAESYEDTKLLAKNLEIPLLEIPITEIFTTFREEIRKRLGYKDFTVADENLQARIRANILFYLSNREGYLVLSTSNKSEAATGYGTIYGDMAGGFAPLKDLYKTWIYRLASYRNSLNPVIPERIFQKPPSAELRPGQTDQETLPPYELLDEILKLHLEEGLDLRELVERGFEEKTVRKVFQMLKVAEYKRRQTPLGPKITKCSFGRDYRIPVTCGYL